MEKSAALSYREEVINALSHGIGTVLAVLGLVFLLVSSHESGDMRHLVSFSIYGGSLCLLYLMSTLYHSFRRQAVKRVFKVLDHAAIYLLIAGTATPFALITLHGIWGWTLFGLMWGLAVLGIIYSIFFLKPFSVLSTVGYILMGWVVTVVLKPLMQALPMYGIIGLIGGGLFYTGGTVFYLWRRLPYHHAIWHLFVLAGSACHFATIALYV